MPRKDPSKMIDLLGKPDSTPEFDVSKFIESNISCQLYRVIKTPVWDSVGDSLEDFYLTARMEHNAMMRQKAILLEHQRLQKISNANRVYRLNQNQGKLRNRFVEVNVFLREFEEKRKSALKRGNEEIATQAEIRDASDKLKAGFNELVAFRDQIKETADEYEPYERVLDDVVKQSSAFNSVKDLMDRCDALMIAQVEISELGHTKILELESMRKGLVHIANEAALQVLGLKNALSSLDRLYETARNECLKWEKTLGRCMSAIDEKVLEHDRALDGINDLYRLICTRRSEYPELYYNDVEDRLDYIKDEVELLQEVLKVFQDRQDETKGTERMLKC